MRATFKNDGFLEGLTTPWDFGSQDDTLLRADLLWEPTDTFSLRFTYNDEQKRGTDPKVHRMTRYDGSRVYSYNVMLGVFQNAANAACAADPARCLAVGAEGNSIPLAAGQGGGTQTANFAGPGGMSWAPPPQIGVGTRYTGQAPAAYNPATHTTNYPEGFVGAQTSNYRTALMPDVNFGPGQVGKWQTKSDSMEDGITADLEYATLTADWDITDNLTFEAILSSWQQFQRQVIDFDGTEFLVTTDDLSTERENDTMEFHLSGTALNDRISWLGGYYSLEEDTRNRVVRWGMYEWAIHGYPTIVNGVSRPPRINVAAAEYVRQTATLLGLNGLIPAGLRQRAVGRNHADWAHDDRGRRRRHEPLPVAVHEHQHRRLDRQLGRRQRLVRRGDVLGDREARPHRRCARTATRKAATSPINRSMRSARRIPRSSRRAICSPAREVLALTDPDTPPIDTYKFSAAYQATADLMVYLTYAEGFTEAGDAVGHDRPELRRAARRRRVSTRRARGSRFRPKSSITPRSGCAPTGSTAGCVSTQRTSIRTGTACASRCSR